MTDYKEIWNELCHGINKKYHNSPESKLQMFAEFIFSKLGWSELKGEIDVQRVIQTGSANTLKPDIIITDSQNDLYVIELKVPNLQTSERNLNQITSYMLQLKLNFGILFGESLQIFYDVPNEKPRKICDIQFKIDSEEGINILKLLSKNEHSPEKIDNYCKEIIALETESKEADKYIDKLCSTEGIEIVTKLLKEELSTNFSEKIISFILDKISISIFMKGTQGPLDTKDAIPKSKAMALINEKHKTNLTDSNTMYSTINRDVKQWSFNRKNRHFNNDTHMILINQEEKELHYFFIPRNTITEPQNTFDQRNDKRVRNSSIIKIPVSSYNFKDENSRFSFKKYIKDSIKY